ncbi:MAG: hypothetical protein AB7E96_08925 [Deferribacterales bacterium]
MDYSQTLDRASVAALMQNNGYKLIKGYVEDLDIGHVTASMVIRSGKRLVSLLLPVGDAKLSGAEVGRPIYCLMNGKDVFVFRDINYMMKKILNN